MNYIEKQGSPVLDFLCKILYINKHLTQIEFDFLRKGQEANTMSDRKTVSIAECAIAVAFLAFFLLIVPPLMTASARRAAVRADSVQAAELVYRDSQLQTWERLKAAQERADSQFMARRDSLKKIESRKK